MQILAVEIFFLTGAENRRTFSGDHADQDRGHRMQGVTAESMLVEPCAQEEISQSYKPRLSLEFLIPIACTSV